jgi:hypothetical protein
MGNSFIFIFNFLLAVCFVLFLWIFSIKEAALEKSSFFLSLVSSMQGRGDGPLEHASPLRDKCHPQNVKIKYSNKGGET